MVGMMTAPAPRSSLLSAATQHWRAFVPAWLFPGFLFLIQFLPWFDSHPFLVLILVIVPAMTYCLRTATVPVRAGTMSRAQFVLWVFLVPMVVWIGIVGGFWAVLS